MTDAAGLLPGLRPRTVSVRGVELRVYEGGDGPSTLLIHGYGGSAWNFSELAPLLAGRRLVVPDLPGHGGSAPLPAAPSVAAFADALAPLLDGPADVLGHSMGGLVALRLAERHPQLVRRVLLAAPAGISSTSRISELFVALVGLVQPGRLAGRRVELIARSSRLRRLVFGPLEVSNPDVLTERAVRGLLLGPTIHSDVRTAGAALVADDPRRDLERVRCPALVLFGARDRQVPVADGFEYARRLRAPLRLIPDCGHLLVVERPDACARAALSFFGAGRGER
ncbi:MAG TPA: alpha/beta fold hydrolase [Gaiellaceae bacterium]|nr:alpha/beta fold hydrolase [Gaiellaceae bacterium]